MKRCGKCRTEKSIEEFWKNQNACKECQRAYRRDNVDAKNRSGFIAWAHGLRVNFGITPDDYYELLELQGGVCAICDRDDGQRRLAVDHDHITGEIRGLLCRRCNMGLGLLGDNPDALISALSYLTA